MTTVEELREEVELSNVEDKWLQQLGGFIRYDAASPMKMDAESALWIS